MELNKKLKQLMKEKKISVRILLKEFLGREEYICRYTITRWLNGKAKPNSKNLRTLAKILGVKMEDFFN